MRRKTTKDPSTTNRPGLQEPGSTWFLDEESDNRWIFYRVRRVVHTATTPYQAVQILDTPTLGMVLVLDGKIQSAELDEHIYHEALVHPAMVCHPHPRSVLILGGGEGATLREVLKHSCVLRALMVDIDEQLVDICRKELPKWSAGAYDDPRVTFVFDDARRFVRSCREKFDVVICDISDPQEGGPAAEVYTREFYLSLRRLIAPSGVFVTQATEIFYDGSGIHAVIAATVRSALGYAESYAEFIPSFSTMAGYVVSHSGGKVKDISPATIARRLKQRGVETRYYCPAVHRRLFLLPPDAAARIASQKRISTIKNPAFVHSPRRA